MSTSLSSTDARPGSGPDRPDREQAPSRDGRIQIRGLNKSFVRHDGAVVKAVDGVNLEIEAGQFCVLLGPSGCGKTTLLRCLAGLEAPDSGEILGGGRVFYSAEKKVSLTPQDRELGMVFQSYALWPHMTVEGNVAFPMTTRRRRRSMSKAEVGERVARALEVVGIPELAGQSVSALSGGQQQRVALARAIAFGSDIICFDEPLSNVDAKVRVQLREEIQLLQRELGFTAIYVTHDQEEAMELADVLVVLKEGQIEQHGRPRDLYRMPSSRYVADFIGTADLLDGTVTAVGESVVVETELGRVTVHSGPENIANDVAVGDQSAVVVRAEDWRVTRTADPDVSGPNRWRGTVESAAFLGSSTQYLVRVGTRLLRVRPQGSAEYVAGQALELVLEPHDLHVVSR
jgi:iron(III) transport system ATP-binding protein